MFKQVTRVVLAAGIAMSSLGIATIAQAQPYYWHHHHWHHRGWDRYHHRRYW